MPVTVERIGSAAVVRITNPPVNTISAEIRTALLEAVMTLAVTRDLDRVILTGTNSIFAAGADAREFDGPPVEPHLPDVITAIEEGGVPWIAAIMGAALGAGAEIALGCRYRIASPNATIGFPEVTLGVVPGAGATQRLPRLIGFANALELISQGKSVNGIDALRLGLVDEIEDDPVSRALKLDISCLSSLISLSHRPAHGLDSSAVETARAYCAKRMRGQIAPIKAIELIAASAGMSFDDAIQRERQSFLELRNSEQARALRHIFFAERQTKPPRQIVSVQPAQIGCAVVVGGGNMGASISYALDAVGIRTMIVENSKVAAGRAVANFARLVDDAAKRGLLSPDQAAERKKRIRVVADYENLPPADLAIEAAFEDMEIKKAIFARLEQALPAHTILATNTSYLDVNEIAASVTKADRVIGLHFFSPAHIMKLVEVIRGRASNDRALATGFSLAKTLGKIPVLSGVCDGFIGNRILARYREAADTLLMDGSTPWQIDEAMIEFGFPMGPYEAQDLSGLDIAFANRKRLAATRDPRRRYISISDRMVHEGRLGRKAGVGWYRYPGGGGPVIDPLVEDLVREEARFAKVTRREYSKEEIKTRLLCAMINEASGILDERIAGSARDLDLVLVHGYGFPRWRGGLMFYADKVGPAYVLDQVKTFAMEDPITWKPAALLERLANAGELFQTC